MELIAFTAAAIALYFAADWILRRLEAARGRPFAYRQIVYFVIILTLALALFEVVERVSA